MKTSYLIPVLLALGVAGCTSVKTPTEGEEMCDDPVAAVAVELPADVEVVDDGNCGGGNDPDGVDPDNPGKGHDK